MELIVRQISGLGNQMFQYAAGRYYAERLSAEMVVAIDTVQKAVSYGFPRPFLLSFFSIQAPCRELTTSDRLLLLTANRRLQPVSVTVAGALRHLLKTEVVTELAYQRHCFIADLPIHKGTKKVFLVGYWQVSRIADAMEESLRREFTVRNAPTGKNVEILRMLENTPNSISLHIRRGDYLLEQEGNVALKMNYYVNAIEQMKKWIRQPTFFVFSDDMEYARKHLDPGLPVVFVDQNDSFSAHEDLRLMSSCRHHIIANSSFSWWGAWLNPRNDKLVIAPRNWMVGQSANYDGLFPARWTLLD